MTTVAPQGSVADRDDAPLPFQSGPFLAAWAQTRGALLGHVPAVLTAEAADGRTCRLPIEIARLGFLRIGRLAGETHANAGRPIGAPTGPLDLATAARALGVDALDLRRLPETSWLPESARIRPSAEERFSISLEGGLDAVLARGNAKRKRKKFRAQQRHFEARGGYRFRDVPIPERDAVLDTFLALKVARFAELGLPDPFGDPGTGRFLKRLFADPGSGSRLFVVDSAGSVKALMGGLAWKGTFWGMFSAFADDEDADASPGELLLWHLVDRLSCEDFAMLDLGPGEERYKRSWCDGAIPQFDAVLATSAAGRAYLAAAALRQSLVRRIKAERRVLAAVQRLRRYVPRR